MSELQENIRAQALDDFERVCERMEEIHDGPSVSMAVFHIERLRLSLDALLTSYGYTDANGGEK